MLRRSDAPDAGMHKRLDDPADDMQRSRAMWRALALRVLLSVLLFVCLLLAARLGWIQPSGWSARQ